MLLVAVSHFFPPVKSDDNLTLLHLLSNLHKHVRHDAIATSCQLVLELHACDPH